MLRRKGYRAREEKCENLSHKPLPFIEKLVYPYWLEHYLLQPRGQLRLAPWQQLLSAYGAKFFHCRQVLYIESEHHITHYLDSELCCAYFLQFTHSLPK
jgi:hypothetical protein